jgi:hypothetical protein
VSIEASERNVLDYLGSEEDMAAHQRRSRYQYRRAGHAPPPATRGAPVSMPPAGVMLPYFCTREK